jgi:hypothetical protein
LWRFLDEQLSHARGLSQALFLGRQFGLIIFVGSDTEEVSSVTLSVITLSLSIEDFLKIF